MIKINKFIILGILLLMFVLPGMSFAQPQFGNSPEDPDFVDPPAPLPSRNTFDGVAPFQPSVSQNSSSYGQCYTDMDDLGDLICRIGELINSIVPVLLALGVVYFVWGVVTYVIASDEEAKGAGKNRIIYGIIGLTVVVGLWGLVSLVVNTFGIGQQAPDINLTNFRVQADSQPGDSAIFCSLGNNPKLQNLLGFATCVITKSVIPLIFALALASFVWGVVQFVILGAGEEKKREQGRQFMMWGVIALTVMICVWGLVSIVARTFNIENVIPQVKGR